MAVMDNKGNEEQVLVEAVKIWSNDVELFDKDNRIEVDPFINKYRKMSSDVNRAKYLEQVLKVRTYVPFEVLTFYADRIVKDGHFNEKGEYEQNSVNQYIRYCYSIFDLFTNLQLEASHFTATLNELFETRLFDTIIDIIPDDLIKRFDDIIAMKERDLHDNYYEPHAYVTRTVSKFAPRVADKVNKTLSMITDILGDMKDNGVINQLTASGKK